MKDAKGFPERAAQSQAKLHVKRKACITTSHQQSAASLYRKEGSCRGMCISLGIFICLSEVSWKKVFRRQECPYHLRACVEGVVGDNYVSLMHGHPLGSRKMRWMEIQRQINMKERQTSQCDWFGWTQMILPSLSEESSLSQRKEKEEYSKLVRKGSAHKHTQITQNYFKFFCVRVNA